jgi:hypothetical protein
MGRGLEWLMVIDDLTLPFTRSFGGDVEMYRR